MNRRMLRGIFLTVAAVCFIAGTRTASASYRLAPMGPISKNTQFCPKPIPSPLVWGGSRLQWSIALGFGEKKELRKHSVFSAQVGAALWLSESYCNVRRFMSADGRYVRWSLGPSLGVVDRRGDEFREFAFRPAVRLSYGIYDPDWMKIRSEWAPDLEVWGSVGPTLNWNRGNGGSLGVGVRLLFLSLEVRGGVTTDDGFDLMLLFGLTDLHSFLKLGPDRRSSLEPEGEHLIDIMKRIRDR